MGSVFELTVRQLTGKWRLVVMTVLAILPVAFTAFVVSWDSTPFIAEFEVVVISTMLLGSIAPLIIVATASVAFSNEIEDRTLANLVLSPLSRGRIVLPKWAASIAVAAPFTVGSAFFTGFIAFNHDAAATLAVTVSTLVSLLLYTTVFLWLGLVTKQAIGVGLLYIVLWEGFFSGYISGIRYFSIRSYAIDWMYGLDARRFATAEHMPFGVVAAITAAVILLFLFLSTRKLQRMDVP